MAAFIPEETIADIENATNIVDVISEVVLLKKQGKNHIGLCPFHSEKTPSFTVSPEKQIFHCFGCGTGGNVFHFLMEHEGLTFPEAARQLAKRCGIEIPVQPMSSQQKRRMSEREAIYHINEDAMDFFHSRLGENLKGNPALVYLEKRKITRQTIDQFRLGYAPNDWEAVSGFFNRKGIPQRQVEKSGLIIPRKGGKNSGHYDRFRDRIMFPIYDVSKKVVGFGGRSLDDTLPKYLNSPETPVYHKSRSLYGLYHARGRCRESGTVHIVEGYFDVLSLYQNGIQNVVATLGTALTAEHLHLLRGYASRIVLVYDSDEAGIKAALRSIDVFMNEGVDAYVVILPSGYDPDAYISEYGADAFIHEAERAVGIIPFLIESAIKQYGLSIEGKIRVLEEMAGPLTGIEDRTARSLYIKSLAEAINVDEITIREKIKEASQKRYAGRRKRLQSNRNFPIDRTDKKNSRQPPGQSGNALHAKAVRFERQILTMMLQFPEILPEVNDRRILELFADERLRSIGYAILAHFPKLDNSVSELVQVIDDNMQKGVITELAFGDHPWNRDGCIKLLTQFESSRSRKENNLLEAIKAAEENNNQELLEKLLKDRQLQAGKTY